MSGLLIVCDRHSFTFRKPNTFLTPDSLLLLLTVSHVVYVLIVIYMHCLIALLIDTYPLTSVTMIDLENHHR